MQYFPRGHLVVNFFYDGYMGVGDKEAYLPSGLQKAMKKKMAKKNLNFSILIMEITS